MKQQQQKRHLNPSMRSERKMKKRIQKEETTIESSEQTKNASGTREEQEDEEIQRILEDFKGIRNFSEIKYARRRVLITRIKNEKGEVITSSKGIANVFGNSTKNYTMTKNTKKLNWNMKRRKLNAASMCTTETRVRWKEFQRSRLKSYRLQPTDSKKGKSADSNGIIRAEDVKACDDEKRDMVRQMFNEIVKQNEFTPEAWKNVRRKVIRKKGNFRPICSFLCKRCTNCSRRYCAAEYIQDWTEYKREIRRDSEALSKQQIILRRTEWLTRNATSGESKCAPRQSSSWRRSTPSPTIN